MPAFSPPAHVRVFQCEWFGADAGTNANIKKTTAAIQEALTSCYDNVGGSATLTEPGTYYINATLIQPSNCRLVLGAGVTIKLASGAKCNMLRNKYSAGLVEYTGFVRTSNVVTVTEPGHSRVAGDVVYVGNLLTDTSFNGSYTVLSAIPGTSWTYASTGSNGSPTNFGWIYNANLQIAAANFVRTITTATITVTIAAPGVITWTAHGRKANDPVAFTTSGALPTGLVSGTVYYVVGGSLATNTFQVSAYPNGPAITTTGSQSGTHTGRYGSVAVTETGHSRRPGDPVYIGALATDTTFNGAYEISSTSGNTWTYISPGTATSPTGTAFVMGDQNIEIEGGTWDGNFVNQSGVYQLNAALIYYQCVGRHTATNINGINCGFRIISHAHTTDGTTRDIYSENTLVGLQYEAPWNREFVQNIRERGTDDIVAFTCTLQTGIYGPVCSPMGQGHSGDCTIKDIFSKDCLAAVKFCGTTNFSLGNLTVDGVYGDAPNGHGISIVDDTAGNTGGCANMVRFRNVLMSAGTANYKILYSISGLLNYFEVDGLAWNGDGLYAMSFSGAGTISTMVFSNHYYAQKNDTTVLFGAITINRFIIDKMDVSSQASSSLTLNINSASTTIGSMEVSNINIYKTHSGTTGGIFFNQSAGSVGRVSYSNVTADGLTVFHYQSAGTGPALVNINNMATLSGGMGSVFNSVSNCTYNASNLNVNAVTNNVFQIAGGTVRINAKNFQAPAGKAALLNFAGSIGYNCPDKDAGVDLGASAAAPPANLVPTAGDQIWNTNATGTGLYGRTAAGAWAALF